MFNNLKTISNNYLIPTATITKFPKSPLKINPLTISLENHPRKKGLRLFRYQRRAKTKQKAKGCDLMWKLFHSAKITISNGTSQQN